MVRRAYYCGPYVTLFIYAKMKKNIKQILLNPDSWTGQGALLVQLLEIGLNI